MRLSDTLLETGLDNGKAYGRRHNTPMVNLASPHHGQQGFMPDLRGINSNGAYVSRNVMCFLLEAPRGFNYLPNPEIWIATLKTLLERSSLRISGLNATLNVEFAESELTGSGEMLSDVSNVTRERSQPVHEHMEKYGMPVNAFYDYWIRMLMMDPVSKVPAVTSLPSFAESDEPADLLPDFTGCTCLYVESDPFQKRVLKAWLITNMMPNTSGEYTGQKDISSGGQTVTHSIQFTGVQSVGAGVNALAQKFLDEMSLSGINPNRVQPFIDAVSADVSAGKTGYADGIADAAGQQV